MSFVSDAISRFESAPCCQQQAAVSGRLDDPGRRLRHRRAPGERALDRDQEDEQGDGRDTHGAPTIVTPR